MTTFAERYVHAATRRVGEDRRADVARQLRADIADRVDALRADDSTLSAEAAERVALLGLGDPDRLRADDAGSARHLVGPRVCAAYRRVLTAVLVTAVPVATVVIATLQVLGGAAPGPVLGHAVWTALTLVVQIAFWITLAFAVVERASAPGGDVEPPGIAQWSPEQLPDLPCDRRTTLVETVLNVSWLGVLAGLLGWQQVSSPLRLDGERLPVLDPALWSFWLPLILLVLLTEAAFEVTTYLRAGPWTPGFAALNTVLGAVFAAPVAWLAADGALLNPAAVARIQQDWPGFDAGTVHAVVLLAALGIWLWDSVAGWVRAVGAARGPREFLASPRR